MASLLRTPRVLVIGAGVAGLVAAADLAARGLDVVVLERAEGPGGKLRPARVGDALLDVGPTVFTMRWVFDALWADLGRRLEDDLTLTPLDVLARHAWGPDERLDLFADVERSEAAIARFAGADEARGFRAFCARARRTYETLEGPFIRAAQPSLPGLVAGVGLLGLPRLAGISPFTTLWRALGEHFRDPRLRQLFGRYATYCGSSPFAAPATLMLVAHVEQSSVWSVEGGMHRLAAVLEERAKAGGARFRYGAEVATIDVAAGRAAGVTLGDGERIAAEAIVFNGDAAALGTGLLGPGAGEAAPGVRGAPRSLSAVTFALTARAKDFPLVRHNVFFARDYAAEFEAIFGRSRIPEDPTVYVCAQDRDDAGTASGGSERLLALVNAPAVGDRRPFETREIERCEASTFATLERCGLTLKREAGRTTTPADFAALYPGTGGALYGRASHGWRASFERPAARSRLPGLYLAGGSAHPGPGVPMAALSGRVAAASLTADLVSTARWPRTATSGGTSTA